jgi:hypothetical protein
MEFSTTIERELYSFSQVSNTSFLVTGNDLSIIVYKAKTWRCADDVPEKLVNTLGQVIEKYQVKL